MNVKYEIPAVSLRWLILSATSAALPWRIFTDPRSAASSTSGFAPPQRGDIGLAPDGKVEDDHVEFECVEALTGLGTDVGDSVGEHVVGRQVGERDDVGFAGSEREHAVADPRDHDRRMRLDERRRLRGIVEGDV